MTLSMVSDVEKDILILMDFIQIYCDTKHKDRARARIRNKNLHGTLFSQYYIIKYALCFIPKDLIRNHG